MGDTNTTFKGKKIIFDYENPRYLNKDDKDKYVKNANPNLNDNKIYKVANIKDMNCLNNDDICLEITLIDENGNPPIDENNYPVYKTDKDLFYVGKEKWFGGRKTRRQKRKNRRTKKNNRKSRR